MQFFYQYVPFTVTILLLPSTFQSITFLTPSHQHEHTLSLPRVAYYSNPIDT